MYNVCTVVDQYINISWKAILFFIRSILYLNPKYIDQHFQQQKKKVKPAKTQKNPWVFLMGFGFLPTLPKNILLMCIRCNGAFWRTVNIIIIRHIPSGSEYVWCYNPNFVHHMPKAIKIKHQSYKSTWCVSLRHEPGTFGSPKQFWAVGTKLNRIIMCVNSKDVSRLLWY